MKEVLLLKRCIKGDKDAWDQFLDSYSDIIYSAISRTLARNRVLENINEIKGDIFNTVILKLIEDDCRRLRKYSGGKENYSFKNWLRVVATNMAVDFLRKEGRILSLSVYGKQDISHGMKASGSPEKTAIDRETLSKVTDAIMKLKPTERLIMELLYVKGLPAKQVAGMMQITPGYINTIVHRTRDKIRKMLSAE